MSEPIYWVWNGWGVLFTLGIALYYFINVYITIIRPEFRPFKNTLMACLFLPSLILTFVLSGWIAGLFALVLGPTIGLIFAKISFPQP